MADIGGLIGSVVGTAASSALAPGASIVQVIGSLVSKAMDFIPDPEKKLELQSHAMDLQAQAAAQELDAVTKQVQASAGSQLDVHLARVRSGLCWIVCAAIGYNLIGVSLMRAFLHVDVTGVPIPTNVLTIFAIIMVGLVGVPQGMSVIKDIMGMPGDSQANVLGIKIGNKS